MAARVSKGYKLSILMRDTRWLLVFIGLLHISLGLWFFFNIKIGFVLTGLVYLLAAYLESRAFRSFCIAFWVFDLCYTHIFRAAIYLAPRPVIAGMLMSGGVFLLYKMWQYRNIPLPPKGSPEASSEMSESYGFGLGGHDNAEAPPKPPADNSKGEQY